MLQHGSIGSVDAGKLFRCGGGGGIGVWGQCRGEGRGRGHSVTLHFSGRVGQPISSPPAVAVVAARFPSPSEHGGGYSVGQGHASSAGPTCASLFSREGGSPVWVPAFAGKHVLLADRDSYLLGLDGPCHAERARVDMPHPDPPLKGREFSSCAAIGIIAIMQPRRITQRAVIPAQAGIHILGGW